MDYVVYCDESRYDRNQRNAYMAIGGLWVPSAEKQALTKSLRLLLRELGVGAEVKWRKTSYTCLDSYKRIVDFFFSHESIRFRVIVVDQSREDLDRFHGGDAELGFYAFYYHMLRKWIEPEASYTILLDHKQNSNGSHYPKLKRRLSSVTTGGGKIKELTTISSNESPLSQVCDLLVGAVSAGWCPGAQGAKLELIQHIARRLNSSSLKFISCSPSICKFNIFKIELS